jgi:hypothetical protein
MRRHSPDPGAGGDDRAVDVAAVDQAETSGRVSRDDA